MRNIKLNSENFLVLIAYLLCYLSISYSFAQTVNVSSEKTTENAISSESEELASPKTTTDHKKMPSVTTDVKVNHEEIMENFVFSQVATPEIQQIKKVDFIKTEECVLLPKPCQQINKLIAEQIIQKSTDDSKAISNLTNLILFITAFIMFVAVFAPFVMYFFQNKENERVRQEIKDMEKRLASNLQDELMDSLKQKINKRVDSYGKLVAQRMAQQSDKHEERLYYVEQVHSDLLQQSKPKTATIDNLAEWIIKQQKDYFALLQLISPDNDDTFTALGTFRERESLPDSFLPLLRFLDKQKRLPGDTRIIAEEIVQEKFGKSLDK